jgi:hypothetical protein
MHNRRARWLVPFLTASLLVSASAASTAFAKNGRGGGKKPRGEVTSFDMTSMALVVAMRNGDTFEGTVDPDAQVKVEHRGNHSHGNGHGNPSRGSLEDIVAGALVLRMKVDDGVVEKIRLRKKAADPCEPAAEEPEGEEADDDSGEDVEEGDGGTAERRADVDEEETDCPDGAEPGDDAEGEEEPGDDSGDDVEDGSDDGDDSDSEGDV